MWCRPEMEREGAMAEGEEGGRESDSGEAHMLADVGRREW
jgi:hypothetical protein